ncbi:MAG: Fic family protein [Patescibacteria group bacterium]|jgi:Fic family protein
MSFNPKIPHNLDLLPPTIDLNSPKYGKLLVKARAELAELKGYSVGLPNPLLLLSPAILKESVASSNIENIHTTVAEVLQQQLFPEAERRGADKEVLRYREAIMQGFVELDKLPVSSRLIVDIARMLVPSAGGYRKTQNFIHNSVTNEIIYTPPPANEMSRLIGNLENFINDKGLDVDPLIKSAVAHYQFEAIHPFGDGNGRTGRILMVLYLVQEHLLHYPILYISGYINKHRPEYYRLLLEVTRAGRWEDFILFMLEGFYQQAKETKDTLFDMTTEFFQYKKETKEKLPNIYSSELVEQLFSHPVTNPAALGKALNVHYVTAGKYLKALATAGYLKESWHGKYHLYTNKRLLDVLHARNP